MCEEKFCNDWGIAISIRSVAIFLGGNWNGPFRLAFLC